MCSSSLKAYAVHSASVVWLLHGACILLWCLLCTKRMSGVAVDVSFHFFSGSRQREAERHRLGHTSTGCTLKRFVQDRMRIMPACACFVRVRVCVKKTRDTRTQTARSTQARTHTHARTRARIHTLTHARTQARMRAAARSTHPYK